MGGFTTTPEERIGPGPPYTDASLQVNLFFRVFLGLSAILACWVPMRLLWKNDEFSGSVFCVVVMILNFFYTVNSLIWSNDNVQEWYAGYGWCDLQSYILFAISTIYSGCVFSIMRNLANRVGLTRATSLSRAERRQRNIVDALVIFPVGLIQAVLTYFVMAQRYNISTLIGCTISYDTSWPYLAFYVVPSPVYTFGAAFYAFLTWKRFREIESCTRLAVNANNSTLSQRHQRARRKLYFMALSILVPFLPIQFMFLAYNLVSLNYPVQSYDFARIHSGQNPYPFTLVSFTTSDQVSFIDLNNNYISTITAVPIFWFFGATKEAINTYRSYLLSIGFGRFFPGLHEEYDPDRFSGRSWSRRQGLGSFLGRSNRTAPTTTSSSAPTKDSILPSFHHISLASSSSGWSSRRPSAQPNPSRPEHHAMTFQSSFPAHPGHPGHTEDADGAGAQLPPRNPFIFRTALATPIRLHIPNLWWKRAAKDPEPATSPRALPEGGASRPATGGDTWVGYTHNGANVKTHVWSDDDGKEGHQVAADTPEGEGVRVETEIERTTESTASRNV